MQCRDMWDHAHRLGSGAGLASAWSGVEHGEPAPPNPIKWRFRPSTGVCLAGLHVAHQGCTMLLMLDSSMVLVVACLDLRIGMGCNEAAPLTMTHGTSLIVDHVVVGRELGWAC